METRVGISGQVVAGQGRGKGTQRIEREYSHFHVDVISCDNLLSPNRTDLDLNIHDPQALRADIDLNQAGVDRLVEFPEPRNKTD